MSLLSLLELKSLKFQDWLIFYILCWWQQKVSHSPGKIFKYIWKMLFSSSENIMDYWNLSYHYQDVNPWKYRGLEFLSWLINFDISTINISQTITSKSLNNIILWRSSIRSFNCLWLFCQYCNQFCAVISRKYKKWAVFNL